MMTISARVQRTSRIAVMLLAGLSSQALMAQTAADETVADSMEIVVTAQKRSERLQDVPISVSAIGGDAVRKQRLTSADDLVSKVANLQLTSTVGDGTPIFALRGVSMSDYSLNQSGPVATYYDEVYKGNFAFLGVALYDLERVEVLRGPQGTLYGKNTTGGAVNLISHKPDLGKVEGYLNLGYGNYNRHEANGAINLPLGDGRCPHSLYRRASRRLVPQPASRTARPQRHPRICGARIDAVGAEGRNILPAPRLDQLSESAQLRHLRRARPRWRRRRPL
ncbi:TonB-dependent receptor [Rhizorhabdus sp.]|uniref:TonB-dependent receptor plug domain-containing protein n=1 Tax=Rhizorhabdus sp. TaxID=1968843 RepID=UPI0025E450B5|nr:TonB-dependent receptor [Rhizorhabdus sp.]